MRAFRDTITVLFLLIFSTASFAEGLNLRHLVGGVTRSLEIDGEYWYQSVGDRLLVLQKNTGKKVMELQLASQRGAAICTDLIMHDGTLWALLKGEGVVELSISSTGMPTIVSKRTASNLGIVPKQLAVISDWPIVFGEGGAVRLSDGRKIVTFDGTVTGVALSLDRGIVYAAERRMYDGGSNEFLGSATLLAELDQRANADLGTLVFTRDIGDRTEVGLMTAEGRDVDAFQGTITLNGGNASLNTHGSRVHVCTDFGVYILGVAPRELRLLKTIEVAGAKDVDVIGANYLAICGDQGREIYRISGDRGGEGNTHFRFVSASSLMSRGHADRLGIEIPTETGNMRYNYDNSIDLSMDVSILPDPNPTDMAVLGWSTSLDQVKGVMIVRDAIGAEVEGLGVENASTVVSISGNFWFGTENGIVVCGPDASATMTVLGSLSLAGPIVQLVPQLDGSAAFVSEAGFVGVVSPTYDVALEQ